MFSNVEDVRRLRRRGRVLGLVQSHDLDARPRRIESDAGDVAIPASVGVSELDRCGSVSWFTGWYPEEGARQEAAESVCEKRISLQHSDHEGRRD